MIEINPNDATARERYGIALLLSGKRDEALHELIRARDSDPLSTIIHTRLGFALYSLRRFDEAIRSFQESLKVFPDYYGLHESLGLALLKSSSYEDGIAKLQKAVDLSGNTDTPTPPTKMSARRSDCFCKGFEPTVRRKYASVVLAPLFLLLLQISFRSGALEMKL